ncbi:MAG TPA: YceH family protein [Thermoanaerobaculia bacterium]|nr:YceH family protein [Thermoanaerobaculia bacterium]
MTFVPTLDTESRQRPRIPRILDPIEIRILGSLMEKQLSTPEYYPLTLNALVAACNQKSNREPVMELSEQEVTRALDRLQDEKLVWKVLGGRATRFDHNLDNVWHLNRREKALITLLFLRGPQTSGELRGRSDRLQQFDTVAEAEETLRDMAAHSEPLIKQLPRRPGQKEERWAHTAGGAIVESAVAATEPETQETRSGEPLSARVTRLEEQVSALMNELRELKAKLGE